MNLNIQHHKSRQIMCLKRDMIMCFNCQRTDWKQKTPKTGRKEVRWLQIRPARASQTKLRSVGCTTTSHWLGNCGKYISVFYELEGLLCYAFKFGHLIRNEWNWLLWRYRLKMKVGKVMSSHIQCEYKQETRQKCHCPYVYGLQMCCFFRFGSICEWIFWKHGIQCSWNNFLTFWLCSYISAGAGVEIVEMNVEVTAVQSNIELPFWAL